MMYQFDGAQYIWNSEVGLELLEGNIRMHSMHVEVSVVMQ